MIFSITTCEEVILLVLSKEMYGLEILESIDSRSQGKISMGFGTLYPTLKRLEEANLVKGKWGEDRTGGAKRKYFSITDEGKKQLQLTAELRLLLAKTEA